jgi:hypothetical protein
MNAFIYSSNVAKKFLLARRGSVMEKCEIGSGYFKTNTK